MGILPHLIVGLVLWVVLWGTSLMKSFDAFLIAMLMLSGRDRPIVVAVPARRQTIDSRPLSPPRSPFGSP